MSIEKNKLDDLLESKKGVKAVKKIADMMDMYHDFHFRNYENAIYLAIIHSHDGLLDSESYYMPIASAVSIKGYEWMRSEYLEKTVKGLIRYQNVPKLFLKHEAGWKETHALAEFIYLEFTHQLSKRSGDVDERALLIKVIRELEQFFVAVNGDDDIVMKNVLVSIYDSYMKKPCDFSIKDRLFAITGSTNFRCLDTALTKTLSETTIIGLKKLASLVPADLLDKFLAELSILTHYINNEAYIKCSAKIVDIRPLCKKISEKKGLYVRRLDTWEYGLKPGETPVYDKYTYGTDTNLSYCYNEEEDGSCVICVDDLFQQ